MIKIVDFPASYVSLQGNMPPPLFLHGYSAPAPVQAGWHVTCNAAAVVRNSSAAIGIDAFDMNGRHMAYKL